MRIPSKTHTITHIHTHTSLIEGFVWIGYREDPWAHAQRAFIGCQDFQAWIHTQETWQIMIDNYVNFAIECCFLPLHCVWKESIKYVVTIGPGLLEPYLGLAESHRFFLCSFFSQPPLILFLWSFSGIGLNSKCKKIMNL